MNQPPPARRRKFRRLHQICSYHFKAVSLTEIEMGLSKLGRNHCETACTAEYKPTWSGHLSFQSAYTAELRATPRKKSAQLLSKPPAWRNRHGACRCYREHTSKPPEQRRLFSEPRTLLAIFKTACKAEHCRRAQGRTTTPFPNRLHSGRTLQFASQICSVLQNRLHGGTPRVCKPKNEVFLQNRLHGGTVVPSQALGIRLQNRLQGGTPDTCRGR